MYDAAENAQVGLSRSIGRADQVHRFKPGKAVHKIGPEEPFPAINGGGCYDFHILNIMQNKEKCSLPCTCDLTETYENPEISRSLLLKSGNPGKDFFVDRDMRGLPVFY